MLTGKELARAYYDGLKAAYYSYDGQEIWDRFSSVVHGADQRDLDKLDWLHFSDCCNNGGTSQLFIDFSPSAKGKKGQVLRFLHDPDEMVVVADSFDEYLQMLIDNEFDFINEDTIEE